MTCTIIYNEFIYDNKLNSKENYSSPITTQGAFFSFFGVYVNRTGGTGLNIKFIDVEDLTLTINSVLRYIQIHDLLSCQSVGV